MSARRQRMFARTFPAVRLRPDEVFGPLMTGLASTPVHSPVDNPTDAKVHVSLAQVYEVMTLTNLRTIAVQRHIQVDGKRPSRCVKAELIAALLTAGAQDTLF